MADGTFALMQLAQANASGEAIGQVASFSGDVFIVRTDGTEVKGGQGSEIFQGDVVRTGADGEVGLVFADDTTFSLGEDGEMTIDEMVYDAGAESGSASFSIAKGVFGFVSGQLAKVDPDAMVIDTPAATIGIRGSSGTGRAAPEGEESTFILVPDPDGTIGEIIIQTETGSVVMNVPYQASTVLSAFVSPSAPVALPASVVARVFGNTVEALSQARADAGVQDGPADDSAAAAADEAPSGADAPEAEAEVSAADEAALEAAAGSPDAEAEAAAAEAFEEALAGGGSLVDAFRAAVDASEQKGAEVARQAEEEEAESAELFGESIDRGLDNLLSQSRAAQEQGRSAAEAAEREQVGEQAQAAVEAGLTQDLNELAEAQARAQLESGFSRILTAEELAEIKAEKAAEAAAKAEAEAEAAAQAAADAAAKAAADAATAAAGGGTNGDDTINGTDGADRINGLDGDDVIYGAGGQDLIFGGRGNDMLYGGDERDTLRGGEGDDTLNGGDENDNLEGEAGDDIINGGAGNDEIEGGLGNDLIDGGDGKDEIDGGGGDDTIVASGGGDEIYLRDGDDKIKFTSWGSGGQIVRDFSADGSGGMGTDKIVFSGLRLVDNAGNTDTTVNYEDITGDSYADLNLKSAAHRDNSIFEFTHTNMKMNGRVDEATAVDKAFLLIGNASVNELTVDGTAENIFIMYDQSGNAAVFRFHNLNSDNKVNANELSLLAILENVGHGKVDETNFEFATDPLIFDLDGDGVTLTGESGGAAFDVDADGVREKTGWMDSGDAMLVIDENQNGVIDGMKEVVSSYLTYGGGVAAGKSSLDALAQFDDNGDGQIDSADAVFSVLKLWKDADGNGVTDEGELLTLADFGITRISLNGENAGREEDGGTVHRTAEAEKANGEKITVAEVSFDSGAEVQDDPTAGTAAA